MARTRGSGDETTDQTPELRGDQSMSPRMRGLIMRFDSKDRRSKNSRPRPKSGRRSSDHDE